MADEITRFEYVPVDFDAIVKEADEFFSEFFGGAVEFKNKLVYSAQTQISCDGVAFFVKLLLDEVFLQKTIHIRAYNQESDMVLEISWDDKTELSEGKLRECRGLAKLSGFTVDFQKGRALLRFYETPLTVLHLYASSKTPLKDAFIRYFS
jgi:hypothetical protein